MNDPERPGLMARFREEAEEHLEELSRLLLELEARQQDEAVVADILRHAHSLKGAAKVVGAAGLERLTHALETIVAELRAGRLAPSGEVVDALIATVDEMRAALGRLVEGVPDEGGEDVISNLLSLAASAPGLDDRLDTVVPGLDPEIRDVLTEFQKSQILLAHDVGKACWEAELDAAEADFSARVEAAHQALGKLGELISLAGLSSRASGRLRFKFLVATRAPEAELLALAASLSLVIASPARPSASAQGERDERSADEAAFREELAKLVVQYVTEAADEVSEAAKLILALEASPEDAAIVNSLFRIAHNLKGSGRTYGLDAVSELAHHMETVLDALRDRRISASSAVVSALLAGADALRELFASARTPEAPQQPAPPEVLRLLDAAARGAQVPAATAHVPAPAGQGRARAAGVAGESIRVRLGKLDQLVNLASEMTVVRNTREAAVRGVKGQADAAAAALRQWHSLRDRLHADPVSAPRLRESGWLEEYETLGRRLAHGREELEGLWGRFSATSSQADAKTDALQRAVLQLRMVPVASLFDTAPRTIRDLTSDQKTVELAVSGADTELDKRVLEGMTDPLLHLLRNAVDHGIEGHDERRRAGKPKAGSIRLAAEHRGDHVVLSVRDDGRGMEADRLIAAAVRKGVIAERDASRLTPQQAYALIFAAGFSTRDEVTSVSGRGVGMDVVKSNIDALKGRIEIDTDAGRGTTFRILLPLSVSVIRVILVESAGRSFCLPASGVSEIIRVADEAVQSEHGQSCVHHRGATVPLVRLSDLLGFADRRPLHESSVAVVQGVEGTMGFVVDKAAGEQTVLLKEIGKLLRSVPHVAGATILPDGRVAVVLDVVSLVSAAVRKGATWAGPPPAAAAKARRTLLVVDDSLTTRELIRGLLESAGYEVVVARHGREAWELLQSPRALHLVVSDVNMPEMDGYELTSRIKADRRLARVPVVLVTSLAKPEEKLRGMQAGADAYIVKGAFDQTGLLARVQELVGAGA